MYESAQKTRSGRTSGGDEISEYKAKVSDLQYQVHVLEDELAESKLKASKSNADAIALKSNYEIQVQFNKMISFVNYFFKSFKPLWMLNSNINWMF